MGAGASNSRKAVTAKQTSAADVRTLSQRNVHAGRVATAIQQAEAVIQKYHPLRNFGCVMTVALVHHSKPASIDSQRKLVELRDTLRWREFNEWVQVTLWGVMDVKKGDKLRFEYYDELGIACQINDERDMSRWMDVMWCHHPLELHVYEPGAAPMRTPEQLRLETAEKLFKAFDVDGSGSISDEEQLMARELSEVCAHRACLPHRRCAPRCTKTPLRASE